MTRLKASELPAQTRLQLGIDTKGRPAKSKRTKSRAGMSDSTPCPGHCNGCTDPFPTYRAWEKHADTTGHHRWTIDLTEAAP